MRTFAYEHDTDRVSYDEAVDSKSVLVQVEKDRLVISQSLLKMLPLPSQLSSLVFEYLLKPVSVTIVDNEELQFWNSDALDSLELVALDTSLHPPVEVYLEVGVSAFLRGSFDNSFWSDDGGIYAVARFNNRFTPMWSHSVGPGAYICATGSELVSLNFIYS